MNKQRSIEVKVGVVSFLALLLLVLGITLGKDWAVPGQLPTLSLRFPHSSGIDVSAPVTINGVKRGQVSSVRNDKGSVLITATLSDISDLTNQASAKITMLEITGGKKIEIDPGKGAEGFNPQTELMGETAMDVADIIELVGDIGSDAQRVLKSLDSITVLVKNVLNEEDFIANVQQTAARANNSLKIVESILAENESEINATIDDLHALAAELREAVETNSPKVDTLLTDFSGLVEDAKDVLATVDSTVVNTDKLIADINGIVRDIKTGDGLASRVIYDAELAKRLDSTIHSVHKFIEGVKNHGLNTNIRIGTRP